MNAHATAASPGGLGTKAGAEGDNRSTDTTAVTKRLQQELGSLMCGGDAGVSAFPAGDSLFNWVGTIVVSRSTRHGSAGAFSARAATARRPLFAACSSSASLSRVAHPTFVRPPPSQGAEGTAYEGLTFRLALTFTAEYPFKPPAVKFETPCFHPNFDAYGNICLDILREKWSAAYSVRTVLQSIQSLLADPNVDSPLNPTAARMWGGPPEAYRSAVMGMYNGPRPQA
jgi:ubiquitin-protein ligase